MYRRATRVLHRALAAAVAVSVVHYADNSLNYAAYPMPGPHSGMPAPSAAAIAVAWFVFTAFGALAVVLWHRRAILGSALALAVYSLSGLVGLVHYTVPGATEMVWWRQAHIVLDIACGLALLGFAAWAAARRRALRADRPGTR